MKRFDNLFDTICTLENLFIAFYKARKGKRNNANVAKFEANLEYELIQLREELSSQTYQPGKYTTFKIYDPKTRMISAAPFRDRVIHHALCNIIEPLLDPTLISDTYANRIGKGTHRGINRCQQFIRKFDYVLKADIRKYFPSIDHKILKTLIAEKIICSKTLTLIKLIIDNSNLQESIVDYFSGDDLFTLIQRRKGLPMGNLTSQFLANLYLSPLDHFIKDELSIKGYVRYVDDFVIFHNSKIRLHEVRSQMEHFLAKELRLRVHPNKTQVFPTKNSVSFLGQRIFKDHKRLKRENVIRFRRRLDKRLALYKKGLISPELMECQLNSWLGHAKQADTFRLRKKIFKYLRSQGLNLFETDCFAWRLLEQQR